MSRYSSGVQGGQSIQNPIYVRNIYRKGILAATLNAGPVEFPRVVGQQELVIKYKGTTFSFSIAGGSNTVQSQVLAIFPTVNNYNQEINYYVDPNALPPIGCTVETRPEPTNTTRINVFRVSETVSGDNLVLDFSWSPFLGINPTVEVVAGSPALTARLTINIYFFRGEPSDLRNNMIPSSFGAPIMIAVDDKTTFLGGPNPLDDILPHAFSRYNGYQTIKLVNNTTNAYISFDVNYGIIGQGNSYLNLADPTTTCVFSGFSDNCTVTELGTPLPSLNRIIKFRVVSTNGDARTYQFTFYPYNYSGILPTVQMTSIGTPFGAATVVMHVISRVFETM